VGETKTVKLRSDYCPGTFMRIIKTEDADISIAIYGDGEFKLAGINGGGWLPADKKREVIKAFTQIIDIVNEVQ